MIDKIYESENLLITRQVLGLLSNNVYCIQSDGHVCIVDPSCKAEHITEMLPDGKLDDIIFTHYHFDHIGAAAELKQKTGATTHASNVDGPFISGEEPVLTMHRRTTPCPIDKTFISGDDLMFGKMRWVVIETPGHTLGSVCFYTEDGGKPILISGDTLFQGAHGRIDFEDSVPEQMGPSLRKLATLKDKTLVLPGHGEMTTIGEERKTTLSIL